MQLKDIVYVVHTIFYIVTANLTESHVLVEGMKTNLARRNPNAIN